MADRGCGHGHVFRLPSGSKVPCGGPGYCVDCNTDAARLAAAAKRSGVDDAFEAEIQGVCDRARAAT